ncbi:MAG: SH3 domain-containing protein [Chloroflexota bacterium]|nr:MAG: SH3 domain-containing protein [Chloroflexota bacterium]
MGHSPRKHQISPLFSPVLFIQKGIFVLLAMGMLCLGLFFVSPDQTNRSVYAQQPTVAVPTVTSTPLGPIASVRLDQTQINVRSGPGQDYPIIGILVAGQRVPAVGASQGGEWVQIVYLGVPGGMAWVHSSLVDLSKELPVVTPPATPTPRVTATLDPTLAARYIVVVPPTQLPTFTVPPPLIVPTFSATEPAIPIGRLPVGFLIIGLGVVGLFGIMLSFLRGR